MSSQESALAVCWRQYKVCSDRLALVPLNFMGFFSGYSCTICLQKTVLWLTISILLIYCYC